MALGTVNTCRPRAIFLSLLDLLSFAFFDDDNAFDYCSNQSDSSCRHALISTCPPMIVFQILIGQSPVQ